MPLYIPPSELSAAEAREYQELWKRHAEQTAQLKFDEASSTFSAMEKLGRFVPGFVHDPNEGRIPLYPTVPTDMAHVIEIANIIERVLLPAQ